MANNFFSRGFYTVTGIQISRIQNWQMSQQAPITGAFIDLEYATVVVCFNSVKKDLRARANRFVLQSLNFVLIEERGCGIEYELASGEAHYCWKRFQAEQDKNLSNGNGDKFTYRIVSR